MSRSDLVGRDDPRYPELGIKPSMRIGLAVAAYHGRPDVDLGRFEDGADIFSALATLHGLAHLILEQKVAPFFRNATQQEFMERDLPKLLERMYTDR